jgi:hypothetical protein
MRPNAPHTCPPLSSRLFSSIGALCMMTCMPTFAQPQLAACDLVDRQLVSTLLLSTIRQDFPTRDVRPGMGAAESVCAFFGAAPGYFVLVFLWEYPRPADTVAAIRDGVRVFTSLGGEYALEKGLGDEAYWCRSGSTEHGFFVRKGNRLLSFRASWNDTITSTEARKRLTLIMPAIVSKL